MAADLRRERPRRLRSLAASHSELGLRCGVPCSAEDRELAAPTFLDRLADLQLFRPFQPL